MKTTHWPFFIVVTLAICSSAAPVRGQGAHAVRLDCTFPSQAMVGEPLFLNCEFRNGERASVTLDLGWSKVGNYIFTVEQPPGQQIAKVQPAMTGVGGISPSGRITVEPSASYTEPILLNEWLRLSQPGAFTVRVAFNGTVRVGDALPQSLAHQQAFPLLLRPRSQSELASIADALFVKATKTVNVSERHEAIRALAFMNDRVAVSPLHRLATYDMSSSVAIQGLERIGSDEAIKALQVLSGHRNADVANSAQSALARLKLKGR